MAGLDDGGHVRGQGAPGALAGARIVVVAAAAVAAMMAMGKAPPLQ